MIFISTYKNTLKLLYRSILIWLVLALILFISLQTAYEIHSYQGIVKSHNVVLTVSDRDQGFEFRKIDYLSEINYVSRAVVMKYSIPLLSIISVMLVLNRDYKDNFYEIENAGGVKTKDYYFGRLTAILTISIVVSLIAMFTSFHFYFLSRGAVNMSLLDDYLIDSTVCLLRLFVCAMLPGILF